jgi:hypothetical protein
VLVKNDCSTCNRITLRAGRGYPIVNGVITRVNPSNREFAYEVILEGGSGVQVRPDQVVDLLPCPMHYDRTAEIEAVASWLQS